MFLNCKTYYSLRYGTMSAKDLVAAAVERGVVSLALTNINGTCDIWEFVKECHANNIKPIAGTEIRNTNKALYILIAANNSGLAWIHRFLTSHLMEKKDFPQINENTITFFDDEKDGFVIYPLGAKAPENLKNNERIGVRPSELTRLYNTDLKAHAGRYIILQPVTFLEKQYFSAHRLLRAIDNNTLLSKLSKEEQCAADENFPYPTELLQAFSLYPQLVTETYRLMESCSVAMDFGKEKNKKQFSGSKDDDMELLTKLAMDGLTFRYGKNKNAKDRVNKELLIIDKLGFNAYFLIAWDLIRYAQSRGFYHVGRGSGANSIVAYCLGITDVDPIELDLYFERFLNPYRTSPPDFDIDFSWTDRDEIIDYVFKRHGKNHVALLGMYSTFKYRAAVREIGKVFGLTKEELDRLATGAPPEDKIQLQVLQYANLIKGFPNHLSIHPGGILVSEKPITDYTTLFMPPKGFATAQLDMFIAEDIGLYKVDILSQRGLGHIRESLRLIKENRQIDIDITNVAKFKKDPKVAAQISHVKTIGCFYIESPAMRQLLGKLRCSDYLTLVAASSIIRPGVASSGMMKAYIERYHNPDGFEYIHPVMKELLQETYGVMVYQEDVIKVAHHYAGMDMGEADILRRAMSGKYRGDEEMLRIEKKFHEGAKVLDRPEAITGEVWRQIRSFGGYSFSKAHSASYAVESYQSLYLKTYFPLEFMVAVINNFGGFYSRELYFLELRKAGAVIELPCVNTGAYYTGISGNTVTMGFVHIKSLEQKMADVILNERERNGLYTHLQDFIDRTAVTKEQLNLLIAAGALRFTGKTKKALLWEGNMFQKKQPPTGSAGRPLFIEKPVEFTLPELSDNPLDDIYDEVETFDFPVRNPFEMIAEDPANFINAADLCKNFGKTVTVLAYLIDYKVVPTSNNQIMNFGAFLDHELNWIDTVHFPNSLKFYPLKGKGFYKITGRVVQEFGVYAIEASKTIKVGYKERKYANL